MTRINCYLAAILLHLVLLFGLILPAAKARPPPVGKHYVEVSLESPRLPSPEIPLPVQNVVGPDSHPLDTVGVPDPIPDKAPGPVEAMAEIPAPTLPVMPDGAFDAHPAERQGPDTNGVIGGTGGGGGPVGGGGGAMGIARWSLERPSGRSNPSAASPPGQYNVKVLPAPEILQSKKISAVANGGDHILALADDGTLVAWPATASNRAPSPTVVDLSNLPEGEKLVAISAGTGSNVALSSWVRIYVWGGGQAMSAVTPQGKPVRPGPRLLETGALHGAKATAIGIGAGGAFGLALCANGALVQWGDNSMFQLGNNRQGNSSEPIVINQTGLLAGKKIIAVSTSWYDTVALCADGTVVQWGYPNSMPKLVSFANSLRGKQAVAIAAGGDQAGLLLCADGILAGWTQPSAVAQPVDTTKVLAGKKIAAISYSRDLSGYTLLCSDGTLAVYRQNAAHGNGRAPPIADTSTPSLGTIELLDSSGVMAGKTPVVIAPGMAVYKSTAPAQENIATDSLDRGVSFN